MKGRHAILLLTLLLSAVAGWVGAPLLPPSPDSQTATPGQLSAVKRTRQAAVALRLSCPTLPPRVHSEQPVRTAPNWSSGGSRLHGSWARHAQVQCLRMAAYAYRTHLGAMPFPCHVSRRYYVIALRRILC